ncbi:calpain-9-like isoform X2 [Liolophura sinensis]|uniref:calpain-9-like isoform X2 n=1 Tax=Liolophura sinensis TaxID=3198878 RepID=UPI0031594D40
MFYHYPPSAPDEVDSGHMLGANLGRGTEYKDPYFPASGRSLNFRGNTPPGFVWKRPHEIYTNPVFIEDDATQYDIAQGELGNCWFMGAAASIAATNRKLLTRVIMPVKQGFGRDYTGRFVFQFWQYDRWMKVAIDDRLPTYRGQLVYAHNKKNPREFWCALLEKAFAKLYGCYEALSGGRIHHAFVDMSGGISECISLQPDKVVHEAQELFTLLQRTLTMNSLLGGSIFKSDKTATREIQRVNGLYEGHAYSITKLQSVTDKYGKTHNLLRLRNPWGQREWKGSWSDRINMDDFIANFDEIEMTHLTPDALTNEVAQDMEKKIWETEVHKDAWIRGVSAGGCGNPPDKELYWKNPQFRLNLDPATDGSTVVISLMEVMTDRNADVYIGFDIYELKPGYTEEPLGEDYESRALTLKKRSGSFSPNREVTLRFDLKPGNYVIIPSTYRPHQESEFFLKIFTEKKTRSWALNWDLFSEIGEESTEDEIEVLFTRIVGSGKVADAENLRDILTKAKHNNWGQSDGFSLETCRSLLAANDFKSREGEIDVATVRAIWRDINTWRNAYNTLMQTKGRPVDTYDLRDLYKIVDIHTVGRYTVGAVLNSEFTVTHVHTGGLPVGKDPLRSIARRYGGRSGRIAFEDFVTSLARIQYIRKSFRQIRRQTSVNNTITLDMSQWMETCLYQ